MGATASRAKFRAASRTIVCSCVSSKSIGSRNGDPRGSGRRRSPRPYPRPPGGARTRRARGRAPPAATALAAAARRPGAPKATTTDRAGRPSPPPRFRRARQSSPPRRRPRPEPRGRRRAGRTPSVPPATSESRRVPRDLRPGAAERPQDGRKRTRRPEPRRELERPPRRSDTANAWPAILALVRGHGLQRGLRDGLGLLVQVLLVDRFLLLARDHPDRDAEGLADRLRSHLLVVDERHRRIALPRHAARVWGVERIQSAAAPHRYVPGATSPRGRRLRGGDLCLTSALGRIR